MALHVRSGHHCMQKVGMEDEATDVSRVWFPHATRRNPICCAFQVSVDILVELTDPNAETLHWLDCLQAARTNMP